MKILSIYPYTHLSSSSLLIDGEIVAASPEERFDRQKMSTAFPIQSANWCLEKGGITWDDLDLIAIPWNPMRNINHVSGRWVQEMTWRGQMLSHIPGQIMRAINGPIYNEMEVKFGKTRIVYFDHHECHAANGFFLSGFSDADILTIDGHGENETCFIGSGKDNKILKTHSILYPHSVGLFYGSFTDYLGFSPDVDEWKVMALYSFSTEINEYDEKISSLVTLTKDGFELDLSFFDYYNFDRRPHFYTNKLIDLLGPPREKDQDFEDRHYKIAGAMQRVFKKTVEHLMNITKEKGGSDNLILSGGAAMNCVFNGQLDSNNIYKDSFISHSPDDSGVAIGACLLAYYRYSNKTRIVKECRDSYWGPEYSNEEIKLYIKKFKLTARKSDNLTYEVAQFLADGDLIGWFQGRMEFGHRALGNRSILADPRKESTKDKINAAVKYRESYRPFAPATLAERANEIFFIPTNRKVRFMERAYMIKEEWQHKLQAVTHVDGTGRIQTVEREDNKLFYDLISQFEQITGVPVLLNTSFNLNGEPVVMSPEHAIRTFFTCGLDKLILGSYIISKGNGN
jgi:carbamoyltransferase